ncbi:Ig-like domain repeat protein [Sanguibacter sp. A247]|uniref:Ig-like domain repeat protein n=1 Tax=unclassified Sanguibacter TaxID=2645534 RepID=UPI003FD786DA
MHRRTWAATCALALTLAGVPALTAAAAPAVTSPARSAATATPHTSALVRGTLVATLGSGRDSEGRPVETRTLGVRTRGGDVVRLEPGTSSAVLDGARPGDLVAVRVGAPAGASVAELRASSADEPGRALTGHGELRAHTVRVLENAPTAAAAPKKGVHSAYLVRVDDAAATGEFTMAEGRAAVARGGAYWRTESGGIVSGLTIRGERTMVTADVCSEMSDGGYFDVWTRAQELFGDSLPSTAARMHIIVMLPRSCFTDGWIRWTGLATVGAGLSSGGLVFLAEDDAHTVAHELGHNLGLGHANLVTSEGVHEYGGVHSVMGAGTMSGTHYAPPALDPGFQAALNILPAHRVTVGKPGAPTVLRTVSGTNARTLRFADGEGGLFYAELRDGSGRDARTFYASDEAYGPGYDHGTGVRFSTVQLDSQETPALYTLGGIADGIEWSTVRPGENVRLGVVDRVVSVTSMSAGSAVIAFSAPTASRAGLSKLSVRYGKKTRVTAKVTGGSAPQGVVKFFAGKRHVATGAVAADGRVSATLPANIRPGRQVITARYEGDVMLKVSRGKRTIKVAKGRTSLTVSKSSKVRRGAKATMTVRLATVAGTAPRGTVRAKVGSRYVSAPAKVIRSGSRWIAKVRTTALPRGKVKLVYKPSRSAGQRLTSVTVSSGRTAR